MAFISGLLAIVLVLHSGEARSNEIWPTAGWETSTIADANIDPEGIRSAEAFIRRKTHSIKSLLIVRRGRLAYEKYFNGGTAATAQRLASVTKSVTSTLAGIAIEQGRLPGIDQTLAEIYPDYIKGVSDPRTADVTMHQLLTMTAGFRWVDRSMDFWNWRYRKNRLKGGLMLPLSDDPGTRFTYATSVSHLIGGAISRAVGMSLREYANKYLFGPMGETVEAWDKDPAGKNTGGTGIQLTPRQMAKFGYLMLHNGNWNGLQIVPREWVNNATKNHIPRPGALGYGYQFWVRNTGGCAAFLAWGRGGQFIVVVPDRDLVIAVTSRPRVDGPGTSHYLPLFDIITEASKGGKKCTPDKELEKPQTKTSTVAEKPIPDELADFFLRYQWCSRETIQKTLRHSTQIGFM